MAKLSSEVIEIVAGVVMMFSGFFLSLLMTIKSITPSFILAFGSYAISLAGFVFGLHGLYSIILVRRSEKARENSQ